MSTLDNASAVEPLQVAAMIDRLNATRHRKDWTQWKELDIVVMISTKKANNESICPSFVN